MTAPQPTEVEGLQEVAFYRKRPIEVEATLYGGINPPEGQATPETLMAWGASIAPTEHWGGACGHDGHHDNEDILIHTLEGDMLLRPGDWVVKGSAGEFYPVKAEVFAETYEAV